MIHATTYDRPHAPKRPRLRPTCHVDTAFARRWIDARYWFSHDRPRYGRATWTAISHAAGPSGGTLHRTAAATKTECRARVFSHHAAEIRAAYQRYLAGSHDQPLLFDLHY